MGNGVFCCHRNNLIEHSVKLDGILSPIEQNNENNKMVKNIKNKKSNSRLNTSFTEQKVTSHNNNSSKNLKLKNQNNSIQNIIRSKVRSQTVGRRSTYLNRTFINILIIGEKKVGKTSLIEKIESNKFDLKYIQSKEDENIIYKVSYNNRIYKINFFVPIHSNIKHTLKNQKDYFILMYDLNNEKSIPFIKKFMEKLEPLYKKNKYLSNIIFLGNKLDLKEANKDIINYCEEKNISHFEISIKNNFGIDELIQTITQDFNFHEFDIDNI